MKQHLLALGMLLLSFSTGYSQVDINAPAFTEGGPLVDISGQWFLAHQTTFDSGITSNQFTLKRGYLTFKKDFNHIFSVRFTQDITLDQEGSDAGNVEMRLKYLYLKINLLPIKPLRNSYLEVGMVHRPWLDYAQHINDYRVQGTFYLERYRLMNSADFGINWVNLIGGKVDESYRNRVSNYFPGKWGSISIGVFNGGGYHALESNRNKTIESRITIRPFPDWIPGLQFSHHFAYGFGNTEESPLFLHNMLFMSYESQRFIFTGQILRGIGNSYGTMIDDLGESQPNRGHSLFGELFLYREIVSLFGRYDSFTLMDDQQLPAKRIIGGICLRFLNGQKILFDIDSWSQGDKRKSLYEVAMEIRF